MQQRDGGEERMEEGGGRNDEGGEYKGKDARRGKGGEEWRMRGNARQMKAVMFTFTTISDTGQDR